MDYECKCCGDASSSKALSAREMMYGTREPFLYRECSSCGSMQIEEVPADMGIHYREELYSSWRALPSHVERRPNAIHRFLRRRRTAYTLNGFDPLGALLDRLYGPPEFPFPFDWSWFKFTSVEMHSRILDFGCGTGNLLHYLRSNGFERLVGYDMFCKKRRLDPDLQISDQQPVELAGSFDLVMSHHALEHVPQPLETLSILKSYLRPGGCVLIRIPVAGSAVANEYGRDWVQLDAPRHLVIPSEKGMRLLAARAGLAVEKVWYDSTAFQFIGSEQYRADIPMFDEEQSWMRGRPGPFGAAERAEFAQRAEELNRANQGDQACFVLRHVG
ncbi:MAG: class I SAM-dependent methyltransferase [Ramlibacter sp.]|nr:class I SAM-dependent methyltransferase [Ramlibacter sp.]